MPTVHNVDISRLNGETISIVEGLEEGSGEVLITTLSGKTFVMYHEQDCCESVYVNDIVGDIEDLVGKTVISAEERVNPPESEQSNDDPDEWDSSTTWTFYDIQTQKGSVSIRWLGESNGYYSEAVTVTMES